MDTVISIATKLAEYTVKPVGQQVLYLFSYNSNVANVEEQVGNLVNERSRVQHSVDEANRSGEEIEDDVKEWLRRVTEITTETEELFQPNVSCLDLWSRYQLSKKAKKMTTRIVDEIQKAAGKFDKVSYKPAPLGMATMASTGGDESLKSRISTLHQIMDALRNDDIKIIGVYGMGGVGKTTLVKEAAQQAQEEKLFDTVVMAVVTQNPELRKIQQDIADVLGLKFEELGDAGRAGLLHRRIKKENKVLVILDNLWGRLDLEAVGVPSGNVHKGCKILLTSRSQDVLSNQMGCQLNFSVGTLLEEEAWQLFKKMAGDCVENPDLKSTAVEVSKKCSGLPVAIVTIARALRDKSLPEWKNALRQLQRPNERNVTAIQAVIYSTVELSYNCLESQEYKSFFLLCGLMGSVASTMDLLKYCMGLGLLQGIYTMDEARDRVHTLVQTLKATCLLLNSDSSEWFKIHDVVSYVAISIASRYHDVFAVRNGEIKEWPDKDQLKNYTTISLYYSDINELPEGLECPRLEFFCIASKDSSIKVPDSFFKGMRGLKVLDLTGIHFPSLPSSLSFLTSLQTLCLYNCKLGDNIDLIGELKNLKILSLNNSDIKYLPRVIGKLTHLILLDLSKCSKLEVIPPNFISRLKKLEELYVGSNIVEWEVEGANNASLSELKHLPNLTALEIRVRDATVLPKDLYFKKLRRYRISIGDDWKWYNNEETSRILKLKLSTDYHSQHGIKMLLNNVENLCLDELKGVSNVLYELNSEGFPKLKHLHVQLNSEIQHIINSMDWWVNRPCCAFIVLESLSLSHLSNLENICHGPLTETSFCKLRTIQVKDCHKLKNFFSASVAKRLLELQEISIDNCEIIEEIVAEKREEDANNSEVIQNIEFRQLRTLNLCCLPRLNGFYSRVKSSSLSQGREKQLIADTRSKEIISELGTPIYLFNKKVALPNLENLEIYSVDNLTMICHNQLVPNNFFCKLKVLMVKSCGSLKSLFPASMAKHLIQLEKVEISDCKALEDIFVKEEGLEIEPNKFVFPRLTSLELDNLPKLKSFYAAKHTLECPSLKMLNIFNCNTVKIFTSDSTTSLFWIEKDTFANLETLKILEWNDAMSETWHGQFPAEFFRKLKRLDLHFSNRESAAFAASFVQELYFLEILDLRGDLIEEICPYKGRFPASLRELWLAFMPKLLQLWKEDSQTGKAFQNLEELHVWSCGGLKNLEPFPIISLQNLKTLNVEDCDGLISLITSSTAKTLVQLREMTISRCKNIEEIVANEGGDSEIVFGWLNSLKLEDLPRLTSFHPGNCTMKFPSLNEVTVRDCPKLKIFSQEVLSTPTLSTLEIEGHTHSFIPEKDDLNISIVQYWESCADQKVELLNVENMDIFSVDNLRMIWHNQLVLHDSFFKIKELTVKFCDSLKSLFPGSVARHLIQLEKLEISDCNALEDIVIKEEGLEIDPNELVFPRLISLQLDNLPELKSFNPAKHALEWPFLKLLRIIRCNAVKMFASDSTTSLLDITIQQSFFWIKKVALPNLENLEIYSVDNLTMICHNQLVPNNFFCKLKVLTVKSCGSLKSLFPASMAKHLIQLEKVEISDCKALEDIFIKEEGLEIEPNKFVFPRLTSLSLSNLPKLKSFYPAKHTLEWSSLKGLKIWHCNKLKMFASDSTLSLMNVTSLQPLFWIKKDTFANLETLTMLEWNDAMSETWHGQFPAEFFRKLKRLDLHFSNWESDAFAASFVQELYFLEILYLRGDLIEEICPYKGRFPASLRELWLAFMPKLLQLWKEDSQKGKAFQNLEELHIWFCGGLKNLEPFPIISLQNLKTLNVEDCDGLINLVTSSTAKTLVQLREMTISRCKNIEEIVANEGGDSEIVFGRLNSLKLGDLPRLTSFHPGNCTMKFPSLNEVTLRDCPKLKIFSQEVLSTPTLSTLEIEGHTHSFIPEKDDLNISIIQYWESHADQKNDRNSEEL